MPRRRDSTLYAGLCASLLAHGVLAYLSLDIYIHQLEARLPQPPFDRRLEMATSVLFPPNDFALGEATGDGTAIAALPGERPQLAPDANNDQPFTSLDPSGMAPIGVPPSPAAVQGDAQTTNPPPRFGVTSDDVAQPTPRAPESARATPPTKSAPPKREEESRDDGALAAAVKKTTPEVEMAKQSPTTPEAKQQPAAEQTPSEQPQSQAGSPVAAADPAPQTDSEIDAFSKVGVAEFRPGRTNVQFGRKTKLTRPRVLIAGQIDLIGAANPRVVLEIHTSPTGKVTDVSIAKSSGSDNIDGPVRLAAYDWWFEPPKDPSGQPLPSEFLFTVSIVGG